MWRRVFVVLSLAGMASPADAHLALVSHRSRYGSGDIKESPCGIQNGPRSDFVYTAKPGIGVNLVWDEYIDHPGYYRIKFDDDGVDGLVDPFLPCIDQNDANACFDRSGTLPYTLDNIPDSLVEADRYSQFFQLPDVACTNCTLQVIQVMTDKPPFVINGDDIYYQCIDLLLDPNGPDELTLLPPPPATGGCASANATGFLGLLLVAYFLFRRARV